MKKKRIIILIVLLAIGACVMLTGKCYTTKDVKILSMQMAILKDPSMQAVQANIDEDFVFQILLNRAINISIVLLRQLFRWIVPSLSRWLAIQYM